LGLELKFLRSPVKRFA